MKAPLIEDLESSAKALALKLSDPGLPFNKEGDSFELFEIIPLSESTAGVIFEQNTGLRLCYFFYWNKGEGGGWSHFMGHDTHVLGMVKFGAIKEEVDYQNFYVHGNKLQRGWSPTRALLGDRRTRTLLSLLGVEQLPVQTPVVENGLKVDGSKSGMELDQDPGQSP